MADVMQVIITLRKEIPNQDAGRTIYDIVKQRLEDRPDVTITGIISNHFDLNQE